MCAFGCEKVWVEVRKLEQSPRGGDKDFKGGSVEKAVGYLWGGHTRGGKVESGQKGTWRSAKRGGAGGIRANQHKRRTHEKGTRKPVILKAN